MFPLVSKLIINLSNKKTCTDKQNAKTGISIASNRIENLDKSTLPINKMQFCNYL